MGKGHQRREAAHLPEGLTLLFLHPAYIAGFFDGEGCIHARRSHADLQISIAQNVIAPLEVIAVQFGGAITRRNAASIYTWRCPVKSERSFLETILPYLIVKKEQAELGLEWLKCSQRGWDAPRTKAARRERQRYNEERFAVRDLIEQKLKAAKVVGRIC